MSFISAGFLFTIMITAFIYYLMPKKYQWVVLLIMSFAFYATYGIKYMGYIIFTIISLITHLGHPRQLSYYLS